MTVELAKLVRELFPAQTGARVVSQRVAELLYYGDFEILEQVVSFAGTDRSNVVGFRGRSGQGGGLLMAATVDPEASGALRGEGFEGDPRAAGALCLLCMLAAAARVRDGALGGPLAVAATFPGGGGRTGARYLLESGHVQPRCALVGAPSALEVLRASRGWLPFSLHLRDREPRWRRDEPARSAFRLFVPGARLSALRRLQATVDELARHGEIGLHGLRVEPGPAGPATLCQVDVLASFPEPPRLAPDLRLEALGPDAVVSAPVGALLLRWLAIEDALSAALDPQAGPALERVETERSGLLVQFSLRPAPGRDPYELFRVVDAVVAAAQERQPAPLELRLRATANLPAMASREDSPLTVAVDAALRARGALAVHAESPLYSEAGMYAAAGIDTVALGPGRPEGYPVWRLSLREMALAVDVYEGVIRRLCG